jgi:hypothetical protein
VACNEGRLENRGEVDDWANEFEILFGHNYLESAKDLA